MADAMCKRVIALLAACVSMGLLGSLAVGEAHAAPAPKVTTYMVKGVAVVKYAPAKATRRPPVVMVHGGAHGPWMWPRQAEALSAAGYEVHVLAWYNHGTSRSLPTSQFIQRGIEDVAREEIRHVVDKLGRKPILIGHSMGGAAVLSYASRRPVERLVLMTPVVPASVGAEPIEIPLDMTVPFGPFPYDLAKQLFFTTLDEQLARTYHALLVPESPQAVYQATRWTLEVDVEAVRAPALVFATELDILTPPAAVSGLAAQLDADYELVPGIGHSDIALKQPVASGVIARVIQWLGSSPRG